MRKEVAVNKSVEILCSQYTDEVEIVLGNQKKSEKKKAIKRITRENRDLIFDMLMVDEKANEEYLKLIKRIISYTSRCLLSAVVFAIMTIIFLILGMQAYTFTATAAIAFFATILVLMHRYQKMLNLYLEDKIKQNKALAG